MANLVRGGGLTSARQTVPPEERKEHAQAEMKLAMTFQNKINTAVAALAFAFVAIPPRNQGVAGAKRRAPISGSLSCRVALGYYFLGVMVGWLDRHPEYAAGPLCCGQPNLIFLAVGACALPAGSTASRPPLGDLRRGDKAASAVDSCHHLVARRGSRLSLPTVRSPSRPFG